MRTFRDLLCLVFGLLLLALVTATADAQGVIVPGPCTRCPAAERPVTMPRALPVKSITIDTKINAQVATTHVEQVFRNDTDATLEGTYLFPIPESASVAEFAIWDGDRRLVGEVRESVRNVYSPSHEIEVARRGGREARVSFESKPGAEPQDFQLFYTLSDADFGMTLLTHREPGRQGYFLLTISPKDEMAEAEYAAKDIVCVLDTSGSMAEEGKMEKARAALLFGVRSLRAEDRFNVINFAGEEHLMSAELAQADQAGKAKGEEFIKQLRPVGGTNINGALLAALKMFERSERPRLLVFLTDGLPTVGETKAERIVENARRERVAGVRLFTFGVGYDVNTALLDKLAAEEGGVAEYIEPKEDLEVKVSNFFTKINHPVLTNLALDMGGVETDLIYPREMPDIFRGTQVTLIGRYRNQYDLRNAVLRLTGRTGASARTLT